MSPLPTATTRCPLCGGAAYAWISVPLAGTGATVGMISPVDPDEEGAEREARLFDRCDDCGSAVGRGSGEIDLGAELALAITADEDGRLILEAPNRASWQAAIGDDGWAAVAEWPGRLIPTRRGLSLLAERNGLEPEPAGCPPWGRSSPPPWSG